VTVTEHRFRAGGRKIGVALLEEAHAAGADLLVMGAFTRGRVAEFVLGGATREVLAAADLPVLMQH
jgi:nucleotide-binding universal stress UspA family protein